MTRLLYHAYSNGRDPFRIFKSDVAAFDVADIKEENSALLLHGGADISPSIYKQKPIKQCGADEQLTNRDQVEVDLIKKAVKMNIPIIGICRGAQLLCALDGGYLIQHIVGHVGGDHLIYSPDTQEYHSGNSCHHQMMVPNTKSGARIIAHAGRPTEGIDKDGNMIGIEQVPEIVYFPQLRAIGIQGHPEWMIGSPFTKYCTQLIKELIL